jgi:radical SAM protein with 4Fe4S-binding SPASM domain
MNRPAPAQRVLRLLFWESTIQCNLTCAHCRRIEDNETRDADLSTDQARDMIAQLAALGRQQPMMPILVFSGGEPLCRPDLFELVATAKSQGIVPALATNGTLIDAGQARAIANSDIERVSISLDGATPTTHDQLRKLPGAFDRAVRGIGYLRDHKVPFQINMTLTKHNVHELEALYDLAVLLGAVAVHPFMLVPVGCGVELAETDMLSPEQYEQALHRVAELEQRGGLHIKVTCGPHYERVKRELGLQPVAVSYGHGHPHTPGASPHGATSRGCLAGQGVLFVGHQGDVFPCGYLPVHCGNILKTSMSDIWLKNPDLACMADSANLEGKCGACGFRKVCGGCRARAYAATGDYLAAEPMCPYRPKTQ